MITDRYSLVLIYVFTCKTCNNESPNIYHYGLERLSELFGDPSIPEQPVRMMADKTDSFNSFSPEFIEKMLISHKYL